MKKITLALIALTMFTGTALADKACDDAAELHYSFTLVLGNMNRQVPSNLEGDGTAYQQAMKLILEVNRFADAAYKARNAACSGDK